MKMILRITLAADICSNYPKSKNSFIDSWSRSSLRCACSLYSLRPDGVSSLCFGFFWSESLRFRYEGYKGMRNENNI